LSLVPAQLTQLLDVPEWELPPFVRAILLGGASASSQLLRRAADRGWPVLTTYGLTEACSQVTTQRFGTVNRGELGSGEALRGFEVRIRDGIIQIRSRTLMSGYFPAEVAPSPLTSDGWLVTHDFGHFDTMGRLHVRGRHDEVIVTGGEKVHPAEIEAVLKSFSGINDACVFGVPDERWGHVVVAAIEVTSPAPNDMALLEYVTRNLASFKRPRKLARLSAFPRRTSGKVDRRAVIEEATPLLIPLECR
jgi:O-succinylbenzoic acid--CoA ligase